MIIDNDFKVGNYKLKYNFESNSQLLLSVLYFSEVGNYKLKYNFESNSQLGFKLKVAKPCWEL